MRHPWLVLTALVGRGRESLVRAHDREIRRADDTPGRGSTLRAFSGGGALGDGPEKAEIGGAFRAFKSIDRHEREKVKG